MTGEDARDQRIRELEDRVAFFRRTVEGLATALTTWATIEQAKGIVMAPCGCSPEEAFDALRRASQRENRNVRDIAACMVADAWGRSRVVPCS